MIGSVMAWRETVDRLRDEIGLLTAVREANDRVVSTYPEVVRAVREVEAEGVWWDAVLAGIGEWDADHPCRAIDDREIELRRLCPDRVLREIGAPGLPGMAALA